MITGGNFYLQHFLLRLRLVRNNFAPWRYADFLDSAAERIFLRKVGGGYMFIHRYLLEYFASLDDGASLIMLKSMREQSNGTETADYPIASKDAGKSLD